MAEIAAIFHWPASAMLAMSIEELTSWRNAAVRVWNRMHGTKGG